MSLEGESAIASEKPVAVEKRSNRATPFQSAEICLFDALPQAPEGEWSRNNRGPAPRGAPDGRKGGERAPE